MSSQKTLKAAPWFLAVCCLALLALGSCTVIGTTIGAISDSGKPSRKTIPAGQTETIQPGSNVTILLKTWDELTGKYTGLLPGSEEKYSQAYAEVNRGLGGPLPDIGEHVVASSAQSGELRGEFAGVDVGSLLIRVDPNEQPPSKIPESTLIQLVDSDNHVLEGDSLRSLLLRGEVPLWSNIALEERKLTTSRLPVIDTLFVAFSDVQQLQVHLKRGGKKKGFLIGLAIDVTILAIAVVSLNNATWE